MSKVTPRQGAAIGRHTNPCQLCLVARPQRGVQQGSGRGSGKQRHQQHGVQGLLLVLLLLGQVLVLLVLLLMVLMLLLLVLEKGSLERA